MATRSEVDVADLSLGDPSYSLAQLRAYVSLASTLSYASAAEQLGMTDGGLHYQIKSVETAFRAKLFEKAGRGLQLTRSGRELLPYALGVLRSARELGYAITAQSQPPRLVIWAGLITGAYIVAPILERLRSALQLDVQLTVKSGEHSRQALLSHTIDMQIGGTREGQAGFDSQLDTIGDHFHVLNIASEYCAPVAVGALDGRSAVARVLVYSPMRDVWRCVRGLLQTRPEILPGAVAETVDSLESMVVLLATDPSAIAIAPVSFVRQAHFVTSLHVLDIPELVVERPVYLACAKGGFAERHIGPVAELVREETEGLGEFARCSGLVGSLRRSREMAMTAGAHKS